MHTPDPFTARKSSRLTKKKWISVLTAAVLLSNISHGQPADVSALLKKADELDAHEQTDAAIDTLLQAEKLSPENPDTLIKLSQDYSDKIDSTKDESRKRKYASLALEYAKRAVHAAPNNADAHVSLSVAYGKMTDFLDNKTKIEYSKIVKSEAETAVNLDPKSDLGWLILARWNFDMATLNPILRAIAQTLYGQMPPASKDKAVEYFKRAIAAAPQKIIHHAEYAMALEKMGRQQEARAEWLKVKQLKALDAQDREYQAQAEDRLK